jgi:hypothetical protein
MHCVRWATDPRDHSSRFRRWYPSRNEQDLQHSNDIYAVIQNHREISQCSIFVFTRSDVTGFEKIYTTIAVDQQTESSQRSTSQAHPSSPGAGASCSWLSLQRVLLSRVPAWPLEASERCNGSVRIARPATIQMAYL